MPKYCLVLFSVSVLFAASGATCPRVQEQLLQPAPTPFSGTPTLTEVVAAVNQNSAAVRQLHTDEATVKIEGVPMSLRANLAIERPRHIRFRADTGLTGAEMDLGSNNDLFWIWIKQSKPPAVLFARHEQFAQSPVKNMIPIEPDWLVEALGLMQLDPNSELEGPYPYNTDHVEIRQQVRRPSGDITKRIVVHGRYGWIVLQEVYDAQQRLLASAQASGHQYDPNHKVSLPRTVDIKLPPAQIAFRLTVNEFLINQLNASTQLWTMPQINGYPPVDLTRVQPRSADERPLRRLRQPWR